jgi:signal transduction histidine kinase
MPPRERQPTHSPSDDVPPDPNIAFGPVALVLVIAVVGVAVIVAMAGSDLQQRWSAVLVSVGALGIAGVGIAAHWRWRASHARRLALIEESLRRTEQFAAKQAAIISMISHELRTPLQAITTNVEYLQGAMTLSGEVGDAVCRLQRAASLIEGRVKNLAEYARATGDTVPRSDAFALGDLLARIVEDYRPQAELKRQVLATEFAPGTESAIQGDPIRLNQIVANYVANAIQHSKPLDRIIVRTSFSPVVAAPQRMLAPTVEIEVIDHGEGICDDVRQSLWSPFVTTKQAGTAPGNSGLGLAVVKLLADVVRWEVGVRPTEGGGSTFYVRLPVRPGRAASVQPTIA